ncbi:MAG: anthranilate phosphoribosyltransferase [Acidobacteria bacterium]|nr:MAG: anthranilate phosphoribosyltransferase [Acidobacteriota bacterium]
MNASSLYIETLKKLRARIDLELDEADSLLEAIFQQHLSEIQVAGLLVTLASKGESINEIAGFARAMRRYALKLDRQQKQLVDTAGTGGDCCGTFNISTAAAFVIAGAGVPVAKHGNRAISGRCGSADVLTNLGVRIDAPKDVLERCLASCGITFLFAPAFHQAMKVVSRVRKELGIRTIFNLLGPLLNPAGAKRQIIGVYSPHLTEVFAEVLRLLGCEHALIFSGEDGLDEITVSHRTKVTEIKAGQIRTQYLEPESFGMQRTPIEQLVGGDTAENGRILQDILEVRLNGAKQDVVLLNAAAGIYVSGRVDSIHDGLALARMSLESRRALEKLEKLVAFSNQKASEP